jgi:hypothetical protein
MLSHLMDLNWLNTAYVVMLGLGPGTDVLIRALARVAAISKAACERMVLSGAVAMVARLV